MPFHLHVDSITQSFLDRLRDPGARRLEAFLQQGAAQTSRNPTITLRLAAPDFDGVPVSTMTLVRQIKTDFIAEPEVRLLDGTTWKDNGLHLPGALPDTVLAALPGRKLNALIGNASLGDRTIVGARNLRGRAVISLDIRKVVLSVPADPPAMPAAALRDALAQAAPIPCDAVLAAALTLLPARRAAEVAIEISACTAGVVETGVHWDDLVEGRIAPDRQTDHLGWGMITVERRKGKDVAPSSVNMTGRAGLPFQFIERGMIAANADHGLKATAATVLGIQLPGDPVMKRGETYGNYRYPLRPDTTIGAAVPPPQDDPEAPTDPR